MDIEQVYDQIRAAVRQSGVRVSVQPDRGPNVDPPALVLGPPEIEWDTGCLEPTSARFSVLVIVTDDDRSLDRLLPLVRSVADVINEVDNVVVLRARPGRYTAHDGEAPAYEIVCEAAL